MEKEQQELIFKLSMFEQQIQQLQQQLQLVESGIVELDSLILGLDDLEGGKGREILAPIGRGIFAKAELISEELTVDVGGKNFVKKSIPETQEMIETQIEKLEQVKKELEESLEKISGEMNKLIEEAQGKEN